MENIEPTSGKTVPVLFKKHHSIEDYKKKISPEMLLKFQEDLDKLRESKK